MNTLRIGEKLIVIHRTNGTIVVHVKQLDLDVRPEDLHFLVRNADVIDGRNLKFDGYGMTLYEESKKLIVGRERAATDITLDDINLALEAVEYTKAVIADTTPKKV